MEAAAVLSSLLLSSSGEQPSERQSCALAELLRAASIGPTLVDGSDAIVQVRISLDAWRGYARDLEALLRDRVTSRRQGSQKILIFHFTEAHGAWRLDWRLRDP